MLNGNEGDIMRAYELPRIAKKKKINIKKFEALGRKIKRYFEEENEEYLKKKRDENISSGRVSLGY